MFFYGYIRNIRYFIIYLSKQKFLPSSLIFTFYILFWPVTYYFNLFLYFLGKSSLGINKKTNASPTAS